MESRVLLKEFVQATPDDGNTHSSVVAQYLVRQDEVFGEVVDWVFPHLLDSKCPYELAFYVAKTVANQVASSKADDQTNGHHEALRSSTALYSEAMDVLRSLCDVSCQEDVPPLQMHFATSVFEIRNKRRKMEDRHVVYHDLNALIDSKLPVAHSYYGIFDGHVGVEAASYAAAHLHLNILKHPAFLTDTATAIKEAYQLTDMNILERADRDFVKSGSTAITALIRDKTIYLSWLGDSQAVLVKQGKALSLTNPHKPDREDERKRIEELGGCVAYYGTWRVNGNLAVSRAFGDPRHKPFVSSDPDLSILQLDGSEDFLILACDGLWDGLSPEEACSVVYRHLAEDSTTDPLSTTAATLVHQSKLQGSVDNITTVVIFLRDIATIVKDSSQYILVPPPDMNSILISDCDERQGVPKPPNVLELNGTSSKKLKNAMNLLSDDAHCYGEEYPVEATALSELPTPPIDDVHAGEQFGAQELSLATLCRKIVDQVPSERSIVESNVVDATEALGVASTVVSEAIETAVKHVSSPTSPLNPFAEPFVMKSFFKADDDATTKEESLVDVSDEKVPQCSVEIAKPSISEAQASNAQTELISFDATDGTEKDGVNQTYPVDSIVVETVGIKEQETLLKLEATVTKLSETVTMFDEYVQKVEERIDDLSYRVVEGFESKEENIVVKPEEIAKDVEMSSEIHIEQHSAEFQFETKVEEKIQITKDEPVNAEIPIEPKLLETSPQEPQIAKDIEDQPLIKNEIPAELQLSETLPVIDDSKKNADEKSKDAKLVDTSPILKEIESKLKEVAAKEELSLEQHVEEHHENVDLHSVPEGIPEAEGVTEDIDSDSEKDGGWSYVKVGTAAAGKTAAKSTEVKSKKPTDKKPVTQGVKKVATTAAKTSTMAERAKKPIVDKKVADVKPTIDKPKQVKSTATLPSRLPNADRAKTTTVKKEPMVATSKVTSTRVTGVASTLSTARSKTVTSTVSSSRPAMRPTSTVPVSKATVAPRTTMKAATTTTSQSNKSNISSSIKTLPGRPTMGTVRRVASKTETEKSATEAKAKTTSLMAPKKPIVPAVKKPEAKSMISRQTASGKMNPVASTSTTKMTRITMNKVPASKPELAGRDLSKKGIAKSTIKPTIKQEKAKVSKKTSIALEKKPLLPLEANEVSAAEKSTPNCVTVSDQKESSEKKPLLPPDFSEASAAENSIQNCVMVSDQKECSEKIPLLPEISAEKNVQNCPTVPDQNLETKAVEDALPNVV